MDFIHLQFLKKLSCLIQLEEARIQNPQIHIYGIVNCGFYEGIQAELALKLLQNWSLKAGFIWSGGIGVGGGGGLAMMPKLEPGHGPRAPIEKALAELSDIILKKEVRDNNYVSVAFPRLDDSKEYEKLDTMGGAIKFDCKWLLRYNSLKSLWLGKKAKKNIKFIAELPALESLSLRGIKLSDFEFLKQMNLRELRLLWNSNNDLEELKYLTTLKEIELWRINKLDNIDFISKLTDLEVIRLQDLKHVTKLPDLSELHNLKKIVLDNTGIEIENLKIDLRDKIELFNFK